MEILFQNKLSKQPKVSFVLLDWSCRESFHILQYLNQQNISRDSYEIIWIEYYNRRPMEIQKQLNDCTRQSKPPLLDQWIVLDMPDTLYYHKHLMYNVGIVLAKGDILTICDSDTMMRSSFVEAIIKSFQQDPNIALHMDEVRNNDPKFYPFNYPSFKEVKGEGTINFENGTTVGLRDKQDPLHTLNYGACLSARREDLIAIGGSDEHIDYLGHVCGPYELTFRLKNQGRREIWHSSELLYHVWHPGQAGHGNYVGPHDGRHISSTALKAKETGRVQPLLENKAIRSLRLDPGVDPQSLIPQLIDPSYLRTWSYEALSESTSFYLWETAELLESLFYYNIVKHGERFYGLPQALGPVDLNKKEEREHPDIFAAASHQAIKHLIEQKYLSLKENRLTSTIQLIRSFLFKILNPLLARRVQRISGSPDTETPPVLLEHYRGYNLLTWRKKTYGTPFSLAEFRFVAQDINALPKEIIVDFSPETVKSLIDDLLDTPEGKIIEEYLNFDIIKWEKWFYGVPQFIGPIDQTFIESQEGSFLPRACISDHVKALIDQFYQQPDSFEKPIQLTSRDLNHPSVLYGISIDELTQNGFPGTRHGLETPSPADLKNNQHPAIACDNEKDQPHTAPNKTICVEYLEEMEGYSLTKYQNRLYGVPPELMEIILIRD